MTRAFLWFVMVATLGGCSSSVDAECPAHAAIAHAEIWAAEVGDKAQVAPFYAADNNRSYTHVILDSGAVLETIEVFVSRERADSAPDTKPTLTLWRSDFRAGEGAEVATVRDERSGEEYSAPHSILMSGINEAIDNASFTYLLQFDHEMGPGGVDVQVYGAALGFVPACRSGVAL